MGKVITERIGFNPFIRDYFKCPICGYNVFVYLVPYGGIWCTECNAYFSVNVTSDVVSKIFVECMFEHCYYKKVAETVDSIAAVIWDDDKEVRWLFIKGEVIRYDNPFL